MADNEKRAATRTPEQAVKDESRSRATVDPSLPDVQTGGVDELSRRTLRVEEVIPSPDSWVNMEAPVQDYEEVDDPDVQRLMLISGRGLNDLVLRHGGDEVTGQMTLLDVHDLSRKVLVLPNGKVPEGTWVPANHVPIPYLRSLEADKK